MACDGSDIASEYEKSSSLQKEHGLALISDLSIKTGYKILDLGCGTGFLSKELATVVGPEGCVVALDNDANRLRVARSIYSAGNLNFVEGRCEDPLPEEGYDLILSNYVFQWIERMDLVFKNVYKSLKDGGNFAFLTVAPYDIVDTYFTPSSMFSQEFQSHLLEKLHFKEDKELKRLASDSHFVLISFEKGEKQMTLENIDGLIQFLTVSAYRGKTFDDSHFNRSEMVRHFGKGKIVINYPIFKAVFTKKLLKMT